MQPSVTGFVLETPRLRLREFQAADGDGLEGVLGDRQTMVWYPDPYTRAGVEDWIALNLQCYARDGYGLWAAVLKQTGEFIGDCGLVKHVFAPSEKRVEPFEVEVGYHVGRAYWNQGYATEAARACMRYGFETLGLPKLISRIRPENGQSARVAEKNGLSIERQVMRANLLHDVWAMTREEWMRRQDLKVTATPGGGTWI